MTLGKRLVGSLVLLGLVVLVWLGWSFALQVGAPAQPLALRVEATRDIAVGRVLQAADVTLAFVRQRAGGDAMTRLEHVVGTTALRKIPRGSTITTNSIVAPAADATAKAKSASDGLEAIAAQLKALSARPDPPDLETLKTALATLLQGNKLGGEHPGATTEPGRSIINIQNHVGEQFGDDDTSFLDIVATALQVAHAVYQQGQSDEDFLDRFNRSFADRLGLKSADAIDDGARTLGRYILDLLRNDPPPTPIAEEHVATRSVHYATGDEDSTEVAQQIESIGAWLASLGPAPTCSVSVVGHADTVGSDETNYKLSRDRASKVATALGKIAGLRIEPVVGWGERRLLVPTGDREENGENRRVEVTLHCATVAAE